MSTVDDGQSPARKGDRAMSRYLRVACVRNVFDQGLLSETHALELLAGCLSPGDESTRVDDSELLHLSVAEIERRLGIGKERVTP